MRIEIDVKRALGHSRSHAYCANASYEIRGGFEMGPRACAATPATAAQKAISSMRTEIRRAIIDPMHRGDYFSGTSKRRRKARR